MSKTTKQNLFIGGALLIALALHHYYINDKISISHTVVPVDPPNLIIDCVEEITAINAGVYTARFDAWVQGTPEIRFRAANTNECLYEAMRLQTESPATGQTGLRIYYGLIQDGITIGSDAAKPYIKYIVIPTDTDGANLSNSDGMYYQADTDLHSWRPCPPYCDRMPGPFDPTDDGIGGGGIGGGTTTGESGG